MTNGMKSKMVRLNCLTKQSPPYYYHARRKYNKDVDTSAYPVSQARSSISKTAGDYLDDLLQTQNRMPVASVADGRSIEEEATTVEECLLPLSPLV